MKELEYCSECDVKLNEEEKQSNRDSGVDDEEWVCKVCHFEGDST
jgi:hypothetical protein